MSSQSFLRCQFAAFILAVAILLSCRWRHTVIYSCPHNVVVLELYYCHRVVIVILSSYHSHHFSIISLSSSCCRHTIAIIPASLLFRRHAALIIPSSWFKNCHPIGVMLSSSCCHYYTVKPLYTEVSKIVNLLRHTESWPFTQLSTVTDGFCLHGRGYEIFWIIGQSEKAIPNEKKNCFVEFESRRWKVWFHAVSMRSSRWRYEAKPDTLSPLLCPHGW